MHVVDGELLETVAGRERPVGRDVRVLRAGDSSSLGESELHSLANPSCHQDVTTVHAYSPPLSRVSFVDGENPQDASLDRQASVESRRPIPSSEEFVGSGALVSGNR